MEGHLKMSAKERERLKIFERVKRGELQQKEAAALCQLEYRTCGGCTNATASKAMAVWCIKDAGSHQIERIRPRSKRQC